MEVVEAVEVVNQMSYFSSFLLSMTRSLPAFTTLVIAFVVATTLPSAVESLDAPPRAPHLVPFVIWLGSLRNSVFRLLGEKLTTTSPITLPITTGSDDDIYIYLFSSAGDAAHPAGEKLESLHGNDGGYVEEMQRSRCSNVSVRVPCVVSNLEFETTKQITVVEKEKSELSSDEYKEEKLIRAKRWIVKWGVGFTLVIAVIWPILTLPAGQFNKRYFIFWAVIAIAWGTVTSAVIISLPLIESWETIRDVLLGMFTNDRLMEKMEEINLKLQTIMSP
ncbi:urea-proton symporter DEGRADATION OF UREA 3 [Perilla frutescens var. frutescens]|nr:urea-proton symporter DEGRADATION OF UREA 3 [Perilla frutescens var. frutescens]